VPVLASAPVGDELLDWATGTKLCSALDDRLVLSGRTEVCAELGAEDAVELDAVELIAVEVGMTEELGALELGAVEELGALELGAVEVLGAVELGAVDVLGAVEDGVTEVCTGDGQVVVGKNRPLDVPETWTSTCTKHLPSAACSSGNDTSSPKFGPMSRSLFHW